MEAEVISEQMQPTEIIAQPNQSVNVEALISQGIDKGLSVDTMERLLAMRRELKAEFAKEAFDRSMAAFQSECPIIGKSKAVNFTSKRTGSKTSYSYAPLDEIIKQVKPLLQRHGFSYSFDTQTNGMVTNFCTVTHELGHSKTNKFEVPIDKEAYMNEQQKFGSANTFGKRYAFLNAFGILTGDEDDDSNSNEPLQDRDWKNEATQNPYNKPVSATSSFTSRPASEAQSNLIKKLIDQKKVTTEMLINAGLVIDEPMTMAEAKKSIDWLIAYVPTYGEVSDEASTFVEALRNCQTPDEYKQVRSEITIAKKNNKISANAWKRIMAVAVEVAGKLG